MYEKKRTLLIILLIIGLIESTQAATLHGTIYAWSDFDEPLRNVVVEVNSTPVQYIVATTGTYSFNLSPGNYLVTAKYYRNNMLEYSTEEDIQIDREGDFVHDLLLFPPTDDEFEFLVDINLTNDIKDENVQNYNIYYTVPVVVLLLSGYIIFYLSRKKKTGPNEKVEEPRSLETFSETKIEVLPEDIKELYDIILKMGGRVTQKDLRKKMSCSEAKVSLMITDLEDRGMVRKIRKGRSNIIIADVQE